jgi:hypothetical protein
MRLASGTCIAVCRPDSEMYLQLLEEQPGLQRLDVSIATAQLCVGDAHAVLLGVLVRQQLHAVQC